jgi:2-polyprenyl-6-methoxyphenol hydroxylase-like FAD-dependent oxidoreductase
LGLGLELGLEDAFALSEKAYARRKKRLELGLGSGLEDAFALSEKVHFIQKKFKELDCIANSFKENNSVRKIY